MTYNVVVVERVRKETQISVDAEDKEDARAKAYEMWENGEIDGEDVTEDSDPEYVTSYAYEGDEK